MFSPKDLSFFLLILLSLVHFSHSDSQPQNSIYQLVHKNPSPLAFFLCSDGGFDDFLAMMDLASQNNLFQITGVSIFGGNSYLEPGLDITRRLLQTVGKQDYQNIVVGGSTLQPVNDFPADWKHAAYQIDLFPTLNTLNQLLVPLSADSGQELLAWNLLSSPVPLTVIVTGPLTDLAYVLTNFVGIEKKIERIILMGGALYVPGNVFDQPSSDGSAEWNFYCDPDAAYTVWNSNYSGEILMFPLDPISKIVPGEDYIRLFGQSYPSLLGMLCGDLFSITVDNTTSPIAAFDTVLSVALSEPNFVTSSKTVNTTIVKDGPSQGRSVVVDGDSSPQGPCDQATCSRVREVTAALDVNPNVYWSHFLKAFA